MDPATPPPRPGSGLDGRQHDPRAPEELRTFGAGLRDAVRLPPSRRRMWTYLVFGLVPLGLGAVAAASPGGSNGLLLLAVGALNTAVGLRIAARRRSEAA